MLMYENEKKKKKKKNPWFSSHTTTVFNPMGNLFFKTQLPRQRAERSANLRQASTHQQIPIPRVLWRCRHRRAVSGHVEMD